MPSSATITAFYSFTANTKARASYVNTNFSNFRGHLVAIDPNTATAATTETYDLGSTEYRWRTGYFREVDFKSNTSTGQALQIVGDTTAGQNAFLMKTAGNTRARIGGGNNYIDLDTTTSQFDFKSNGSTVGSIKSTGILRKTFESVNFTLSSAIQNQTWNTNVSSPISTFQLTINTVGRPVRVGLTTGDQNTSGFASISLSAITTTSVLMHGTIQIYRDTTTSLIHTSRLIFYNSGSDQQYFAASNIFDIDFNLNAGSYTYKVYAFIANTSVSSMLISNCRMYAYEIA